MLSPAEAQERALRECTEAIVCTAGGLGLVTATPLQQAICRIADGRPLRELAEHPHVLEAVGRVDLLWGEPPDELVVLLPSRTGKSTIIAGMAIRATQVVDLTPATTEGEPPTYPILSLDKEKAKAVYGVVERALKGKYRHLCLRDPRSSENGGSALVRHPSGAEVEIAVVAGKAAGAAVISRWLIGLAIDEAARMQGSGRVINLPDTLSAARDRMLPGAQIAMISSKWAPYGPIYNACRDHGGRPNKEQSIVVVGAKGGEAEKVNPTYYTPKKLAKLKAKKDQNAWRVARNEWQAPPENLFELAELQKVARPLAACDCTPEERSTSCPHNDTPPHPRQHYLGMIDPATRSNAWTFEILTVKEILDASGNVIGYRDSVALCRQWQGSSTAPLNSDALFGEIADLLRPYRCNRVLTDQWAADPLVDLALMHGLYLVVVTWTNALKWEAFRGLGTAIRATALEQTSHRSLELHPCPALLADLSRVQKRATPQGVTVDLPVSSDGRHCDYAANLALGYTQVLKRPDEAAVDETAGDRDERLEREALRRLAEEQERARQGDGWGGCEHEGVSYDE